MNSPGQKAKHPASTNLKLENHDQVSTVIKPTSTTNMHERDSTERSRNHSLRYLKGALTGDPQHQEQEDLVEEMNKQDTQSNLQQIIYRQPRPNSHQNPVGVLKQSHHSGTSQQLQPPPPKQARPHSCHVMFSQQLEGELKAGSTLKTSQTPSGGSHSVLQTQYIQQLQQHVNEKLCNYPNIPQQQQVVQRNQNNKIIVQAENPNQKSSSPSKNQV